METFQEEGILSVVLTQDCDVTIFTSDYQSVVSVSGEDHLEVTCDHDLGRGGDTMHGHRQTVCTGGQHQARR